MKPPIEKLVGTTLGKCKVLAFCGQGQVGAVFHGHHQALEREVAIKLIFSEESREYFLHHSRQIVALEHENIVSIYDISFDEKWQIHYLVEQWIDGQTLERILRQQASFPLIEALTITGNIARILAYAHRHGVCHGNLTPANVFCCELQVKLKDFGLVPVQTVAATTTIGPLDYLAPEQLRGELPGPASDIYMLGLLFYRLITGEMPAPENRTTTGKFPLHVPDEIAECIVKMLAEDPEQRFSDAGQFLLHLEKLEALFNKKVCPRCGKRNNPQQVFHCDRCHTQNLCFSHLVPSQHSCDRCANSDRLDLAHRFTRRLPQATSSPWLQLLPTLRDIANNNKQGVLVLSTADQETGIVVLADHIEITMKMPWEQARARYAHEAASQEELFRQVAHASIVRFFEAKDIKVDFWQEETAENIVPEHQTRFGLGLAPGGFLIAFSQILRLYLDVASSGGLALGSADDHAGLMFHPGGVIVAHIDPKQQLLCQAFDAEAPAMAFLLPLFSIQCRTLQHRSWLEMPIQDLFCFPSPAKRLLQMLSSAKSWNTIGSFIPEPQVLLPASNDWHKPFGGIPLGQLNATLVHNLVQYFVVTSFAEFTGLTPWESLLILAAVARERVIETVQVLIAAIEDYGRQMGNRAVGNILDQARQLAPEHPQLLQLSANIFEASQQPKAAASSLLQLGEIHRKMQDFGLALSVYEKAVQLAPEQIEAGLALLELYQRLERREKLQRIGLQLFNQLGQEPHPPEVMEKVCNYLLQVDSSLAACRQELIKIYLARNDKTAAIREYEALVRLYERAKSKKAMAIAMAHILKLGGRKQPWETQLQRLGYSNWKQLLQDANEPSTQLRLMLVRATIALSLIVVIIIAAREYYGWRRIESLAAQVAKSNSPLQLIEPGENIARRIYCSGINSRARDVLNAIARRERQLRQQKQKTVLAELANAVGRLLQSYERLQEWQKAAKLCKMALKQFQDPARRQSLELKLQRYRKELQEQRRIAQRNAQRLLARAKSLEEQEKYPEAIRLYHRIRTDPYLRDTAVASTIMLPLLIETRPARGECFVDGKSIGKTPLVLYYRPDQFPQTLRVQAKGFSEIRRQTKTVSGAREYLWKLTIFLEYTPLVTFTAAGVINGPLTIESGRLYFTTTNGYAYAVASDNQVVWRFHASAQEHFSGGILVDKSKAYWGSRSGQVYAVDRNSGKLRWQYPLDSPVPGTPCSCGDDLAIVCENARLFLLTSTGRLRQQQAFSGQCNGSVVAYKNLALYFATTDGTAYGWLKSIGKSWQQSLGGPWRGGPLLAKRRLYLQAQHGLHCFNLRGQKHWSAPIAATVAQNALAVKGEHCFVGTTDGLIYCFDAANGKRLWRYDIGGVVTPAILAISGNVFVSNHNGEALILAQENGRPQWKWNCRRPSLCRPAIHGDMLFLGGQKQIAVYWLQSIWQQH